MFGEQDDAHTRFKDISRKVKARGNRLKFILFYLSPGDYHRYHSAAIFSTNFRRHIAGKLFPVKPSYVANHPNVFKENERVTLTGEWANGFYSTTFIGATNVGSIVLNFDDSLKTNTMLLLGNSVADKSYSSVKSTQFDLEFKNSTMLEDLKDDVTNSCDESGSTSDNDDLSEESKAIQNSLQENFSGEVSTEAEESPPAPSTFVRSFGDFKSSNSGQNCLDVIEAEDQKYIVSGKGINLTKGQEMGFFKMGSSIMLIFEAPEESTFDVEVGQKVKLGNNILSSF